MRYAVFALLLVAIQTIYKDQQGQNDWHLSTFGRLSNFQFLDLEKAFYLSADGGFGIMEQKSGSMLAQKKGELVHQYVRDEYLYLINGKQRQLELYSGELQVVINRLALDKDDMAVCSVHLSKAGDFYVMTQKAYTKYVGL